MDSEDKLKAIVVICLTVMMASIAWAGAYAESRKAQCVEAKP